MLVGNKIKGFEGMMSRNHLFNNRLTNYLAYEGIQEKELNVSKSLVQ